MSQDKDIRDALEIFASALEAAVTQLKQNLGVATTREIRPPVDLAKIRWEEAKSEKGPYDKATDQFNAGNEEYEKLRKSLEFHEGKMTISTAAGPMFIWLFPDKNAIGMKKAQYTPKPKKEGP